MLFGPGKLGIKLKSRSQQLTEGEAPLDCVYLENVPDEDITIVGPGKRVPLLRREPVILAVNGASVTGKSLKAVVQALSEAPRPLTLRLQIGVAPAQPLASTFTSGRFQLSPVVESPTAEASSPENSPSASPLPAAPPRGDTSPIELDLEGAESVPLSPQALSTPPPRSVNSLVLGARSEERVVRRYYRERSARSLGEEKQEEEEELDETEVRAAFVEKLRVFFLLEMCDLLQGYEQFVRRGAGVG